MSKLAINGGEPLRTKGFPEWPVWNDDELNAVKKVIVSGKWGAMHGDMVREFEREFAEHHGAKHGICVNSGTTALRIALLAIDIEHGDEVILPPYTFIASASAALEANAIPVFADIESSSFNIDPAKVEETITDATKAIMPVHLGGIPADMDSLNEIAQKHKLKIVEDAAQAWGSALKGKNAGTLGDLGCFSFQSSKNITAGEGGIILTNDDDLAAKCRSLINCGRVDGAPFYEHHLLGGNYRLSELHGAVLLAQFSRYDDMKRKREDNAAYLKEKLSQIDGIEPVTPSEDVTSCSYHFFFFKYKKERFNNTSKDRFLEAFQAEGIPNNHGGYSIPLYEQPVLLKSNFGPYAREADYSNCRCPETEKACHEEAVWIKQMMLLGEKEDMDDIAAAVVKISENKAEL